MAECPVALDDEESLHTRTRIQPLAPRYKESSGKHPKEGTMPPTFCELLSARLGLEEFCSLEVWQASIAELVGTLVLVFAIDTIVISSSEADVGSPNTVISVFISLSITILLLATFPISGGHLNPVISFAATLLGHVSPSRAAVYILAQCTGATLGALVLQAILNNATEQAFSLGGCTLTIVAPGPHGPKMVGIDVSPALWLEIVCTFVLLFASVWIAFDEQHARALGPVIVCAIVGTVVGIMVFVSTTITKRKGYSGAGMNPARCFGPAIVRGGDLWKGHWVFWVGPFIACVAFYVYAKLIPPQHFHAHGHKYDFYTTLVVLLGSGNQRRQEC